MASHIRFRKRAGCPPEGICQVKGYPYTSYIALISLVVVLLSMPLIPGQGTGLVAGIVMVVLYAAIYFVTRFRTSTQNKHTARMRPQRNSELVTEFSEELTLDQDKNKEK
jgi:L-asparagine transporter-like permease